MARKLNVPKTLKAPVPVAPFAEDEPGVICVPRVFHARARLVEQMRLEELDQRRQAALNLAKWREFISVWRHIGQEVAAIRHFLTWSSGDYEAVKDSVCGIQEKLRADDWADEGRHKYEGDIYRVTCRRCLQVLLGWADCAKTQWDRLDEIGEENGKW